MIKFSITEVMSLKTQRKKVISFVVIMVATISVLSLSLHSVAAQTARIFENAVIGVKIPYPAGWSVEHKGTTVTFKSPSGTSGIQLSGVLDNNNDLDLEEAANAQLNAIKLQGLNFQILNRGPVSINGDDFYSVLLKVQFNDGLVAKDLYLFTEASDTPYIFKLESLDDQDNRELSDQLYSEGLGILQQMVMSAELTGLDLDSLKEGEGGDFNPFEQGPGDQGGGFGGQSPDGGRGNNGGEDAFPQQQPSPSEPLCGPGSCIIS